MMSVRQILLALLLAIQLAAGAKYGCVFDCYLYDAQGSAQGYLEFDCNNTIYSENYCCSWERCIEPSGKAYMDILCPTAPIPADYEGGFAKYSVVSNDSPKAQFPRQTSSLFL